MVYYKGHSHSRGTDQPTDSATCCLYFRNFIETQIDGTSHPNFGMHTGSQGPNPAIFSQNCPNRAMLPGGRLLMGRDIRTQLPRLPHKLDPQWPDRNTVKQNDEIGKAKSAKLFNKRTGAIVLPELENGQTVRIRLPRD